jgi:diguanylate cyclase (GGDEF)-like protein/hemerythrin-like metal-binding protein/PAS domain S-box-containing protein
MSVDYKILAEQFESIIDHLPALVFYKDRNNCFIHVNKYVADAYNKSKKEMEGASLYDLTTKEEADAYYQDDLHVMNTGVAKLNIEEKWNTKDGLRWVSTSKIPFLDKDGAIVGVIGFSIDVTDRKHADHLIKELIRKLALDKDYAEKNSLTDSLTRIPNRRHFDDTLKKEYFRLKRSNGFLSLVMLDIDFFKRYNDRYGHLAGDDCLLRVASAIRAAVLRTSDFAARYGGEEFAVILPETTEAGAAVIANRLLNAVAALSIPHEDSETSYVTVSIGVATVRPDQIETPDKIIEIADNALCCAKRDGRNRYVLVASAISVKEEKNSFINLVWHESDRCGNSTIDKQHEELYKLSNKLIYFISSGRNRRECEFLLNQLIDDTVTHFRDEEEILRKISFPLTEAHQNIHHKLTLKAAELLNKFNNNELAVDELIKFIAIDMILEHLLVEDKKYYSYLKDEKHA